MIKPTDLIEWATEDPIAVILFYTLALSIIVFTNRIGKGKGNMEPYNYINSFFIYLLGIPGILSLTLWGYSITFESKRIDQLDPFAYYLPIVAMIVGFAIIRQNAVFRTLPWFGELTELLVTIAVAFAFVLLMMQLEIIQFQSIWLVVGVFIVLFGVFKFIWERFQRMTR